MLHGDLVRSLETCDEKRLRQDIFRNLIDDVWAALWNCDRVARLDDDRWKRIVPLFDANLVRLGILDVGNASLPQDGRTRLVMLVNEVRLGDTCRCLLRIYIRSAVNIGVATSELVIFYGYGREISEICHLCLRIPNRRVHHVWNDSVKYWLLVRLNLDFDSLCFFFLRALLVVCRILGED